MVNAVNANTQTAHAARNEETTPELDNTALLNQEKLKIASDRLQAPISEAFRQAGFNTTTTGEIEGVGHYTLKKDNAGQGGTIEVRSPDGGAITLALDASGQIFRASTDNFDVNDLIPTPELDNAKLLNQDGLRIASQALQGPVKQAFDSAAFDSTTTGELDGIGTYTLRKNPAGQGGIIEVQLEDGGSVTLKLDASGQITRGSTDGVDINSLIPTPELDETKLLDQDGLRIASQALQGPVKQAFDSAAFDSTTTGELDGIGTYTLRKNPAGQGGIIEVQLEDGGSVTLKLDASGQITRGSTDGVDINSLIPTPELDDTNLLDQEGLQFASVGFQDAVKQAFDGAAFDSKTTGTIPGVGTYNLQKNPAGQGGIIEIQLEDGGSVTLKLDASGQITRGSTENFDVKSLVPNRDLFDSVLNFLGGNNFAGTVYNAQQTNEIIDLVNNANFDPETKQSILFALNFYLRFQAGH